MRTKKSETIRIKGNLKKYHEEILSDSWIEKKAKHFPSYENIRKQSLKFIKKYKKTTKQ